MTALLSASSHPAAGSAPLPGTVADMSGITLLCVCGLLIVGAQPDSVPPYCAKIHRCPGGANATLAAEGG